MASPDTTHTYDVTHLCDYARGVVDPAALPSFCERLERSPLKSRTVQLFRRVHAFAKSEQHVEAPAYAVRVAKAVAGLRRTNEGHDEALEGGLRALLSFLPACITFDSLQSAGAGTRVVPSLHQRIVSFQAADFSIHVKLEQETNPYSQVVVGQLLRGGTEPQPVAEVPVLVLADNRVVGRSLTNRFGEFQADALPPDPLKLYLLTDAGKCIDISLGAHPEDA